MLRPDRFVIQRLSAVPTDELFTTSITLGELLFGALRRSRSSLLVQIEELTQLVPTLPFGEEEARPYAELKARLESEGTPLAEPDLRIAAIALSNGLTLVSGNIRHFNRVPGLKLENWLTPPDQASPV